MSNLEFLPEAFLDFCQRLLENKDTFENEPLFRTIINRCYVAVYVTLKTELLKRGYQYSDNYKDYKKVERDVRREFKRNGKCIQDQLSTLREARKKVDYDYPFPDHLDRIYVDYCLSISQKILAKI